MRHWRFLPAQDQASYLSLESPRSCTTPTGISAPITENNAASIILTSRCTPRWRKQNHSLRCLGLSTLITTTALGESPMSSNRHALHPCPPLSTSRAQPYLWSQISPRGPRRQVENVQDTITASIAELLPHREGPTGLANWILMI